MKRDRARIPNPAWDGGLIASWLYAHGLADTQPDGPWEKQPRREDMEMLADTIRPMLALYLQWRTKAHPKNDTKPLRFGEAIGRLEHGDTLLRLLQTAQTTDRRTVMLTRIIDRIAGKDLRIDWGSLTVDLHMIRVADACDVYAKWAAELAYATRPAKPAEGK
nr:type I-E CRISPR-associated protein Cse2/CasB [Bifidobacterium sp. SO1]